MGRRQAGFTLLELLVAISVSALLVSLVYGAVRIGQRSWETGRERITHSETGRVGWQFLHRAMGQARELADPLNPQTVLFAGRDDGVTFVADMPGWLGLGGLYVVRLHTRQSDSGQSLVVERTLYSEYRQPNLENHPHAAVLVEELRGLRLRYFGTTTDADNPAWHASWEAQPTLPLLVQVEVSPLHGEPWPMLIAHPLLGTNRTISSDFLEDAG